MMNQLTIFDVMVEDFDESKAIFHKTEHGSGYCFVKIIVPPEVLSPLESKGRVPEQKVQEWADYVSAVGKFRSSGFGDKSTSDWGEACDRFTKIRDAQEPVVIKVHKNFIRFFRPRGVLEYLS